MQNLNYFWQARKMADQDTYKLTLTESITPEIVVMDNAVISYPLDKSQLNSHLKELTWRDGAEILADAANLIPGLGNAIKAIVGLDKYSPQERIKDRQFQWVLEQISKISGKLDKLLAELPLEEQPEPADVAAIIEAAMEASRKTAGAEKRQLLKNAVVNSFNPAQYQTGLTLRFFSILQDVEYGDVELLRRIASASNAVQLKSLGNSSNSLDYHHLQVLNKLDLVLIWNHALNTPLEMNTESAHTKISELGGKFLEFVAQTNEVEVDE
jgi:hypothetical protein